MRGAWLALICLLAPGLALAAEPSDDEPAEAPAASPPTSPAKPTDEVAPPPAAPAQAPASMTSIPNLPPPDVMYEGRIRASIAAAQSLQGPLDGRWVLSAADGRQLYMFQMVDKPGGSALPEGVWRDLRRPQTPGDIGVIDSLLRTPGALSVAFAPKPGGATTTVTLKMDSAGGWTGKLFENGAVTPVRMGRP